jgi:hypothetical protein
MSLDVIVARWLAWHNGKSDSGPFLRAQHDTECFPKYTAPPKENKIEEDFHASLSLHPLRVVAPFAQHPPTWTAMLRSRTSLAAAGVFCVFLLIATGFIVNTRPSGHFSPSFSGARPSQEAVPNEGVPAAASSTPSIQHSNESSTTPAPVPLAAFQELSRFDGYGLSSVECEAEFKDLFKEIQRSTTGRKDIGKVSSSDIDLHWKQDGALRAMIWRQKVPATAHARCRRNIDHCAALHS